MDDFADPFKVTTNEIVANAKGVYDQVIRSEERVERIASKAADIRPTVT